MGVFYAAESTVLRVLGQARVHLPGNPAGPRAEKRPWPGWAELGRVGSRGDLHFRLHHFTAERRCAVAVLDVVSRYWLSTVVSAQESSTQVGVTFTRALVADGKEQGAPAGGRSA